MAKDTRINQIPKVSEKLVEKLAKHKEKIINTQKLRNHTADWPSGKIEGFAKRLKVDKQQMLDAVAVSRVLLVNPVPVVHGYYLVKGCNIPSARALAGSNAGAVLQCMEKYHAGAQLLRKLPTEADLTAWIAAAKTAGEATEGLAWENTVMVHAFYKDDPDVTAKFKKAKLETNIQIFEKLFLGSAREKFAKRTKLPLTTVEWYAAVADLTRLKDIRAITAHLIYKAGFNSLALFGSQNPAIAHQKLGQTNAALKLFKEDLTLEQVTELINKAKLYRTNTK